MKCDQCRDKLKEYIEGNLSLELDEEIEKHLLTCDACKKVYEKEEEEYKFFKEAFSFDHIDFNISKESIINSIDKNKYKGSKGFFRRNNKILTAVAAILVIAVVGTPVASNILKQNGFQPLAARSADIPKAQPRVASDDSNLEVAQADASEKEEIDNKEGLKSKIQGNTFEGVELYTRKEVDIDTKLESNTPFINTEDGKYMASIDGKGELAVEEGNGILYIKDVNNKKLYQYSAIDENSQKSTLSISWYDNTHLMVIYGLSYGTLCNGEKVIMLDVTNGKQVLMASAEFNGKERYKSIDKIGDTITLNKVIYLDDALNEYKEESTQYSNYKIGDILE